MGRAYTDVDADRFLALARCMRASRGDLQVALEMIQQDRLLGRLRSWTRRSLAEVVSSTAWLDWQADQEKLAITVARLGATETLVDKEATLPAASAARALLLRAGMSERGRERDELEAGKKKPAPGPPVVAIEDDPEWAGMLIKP
ncbi:MAG: hypothetical protein A2Y38_04605 [Spirochaetes bacterium GWB1_59_5]|nr:MAG: hypothetical protein A2Y38_04605 [Spirochaetes bacterium GWB1_59_5]